jgi:hypothetical protein
MLKVGEAPNPDTRSNQVRCARSVESGLVFRLGFRGAEIFI